MRDVRFVKENTVAPVEPMMIMRIQRILADIFTAILVEIRLIRWIRDGFERRRCLSPHL